MAHSTTKEGPKKDKKRQWNRGEVASNLVQFEKIRSQKSQRQATGELEIPRTTLQYWLKRQNSLDASPVVVAFFESPEGQAILHRLVIAEQLMTLLISDGSIRMSCTFLELSGLSVFVAASYGAQQQAAVALEKEVIMFSQQERGRLAAVMDQKKITVCEDETFHPEICLVAIEPISNFIILEEYAAHRDTETWAKATQGALSDLSVTVIQVVSDEARGLIRHAKIELGAHHSPDLFHGLHEISKGSFPFLSSQIARTRKECEKAVQETKNRKMARQEWESQPHHRPGRPPEFARHIFLAEWQEAIAEEAANQATARKERVREIVGEIGNAYHPFDLTTGSPRQAEHVGQLFGKAFSDLDAIARDASLPERAVKRIDKARRLVPSMLETISFFWSMVSICLKELALLPNVEQAMLQNLIPAYYLRYAAGKAKPAEGRAMMALSEKLLVTLRDPGGPFALLGKNQVQQLELVAKECAGFFQRSSSCVEGRNGQLSLRHHTQHKISCRKLQALTAVHNYYIKRPDGTTAAERFFGNKPKDLFECLLSRIALPARPAKKRSKPTPQPCLVAA